METARAVQGQGYLRERGDDQAEGEEDQINDCCLYVAGMALVLGCTYIRLDFVLVLLERSV